MSYKIDDIKYETKDFFIIAVGDQGFEVCKTGICHATRRAQIGHGEGLGLPLAIRYADRFQKEIDEKRERISKPRVSPSTEK